MSWAWWQVLVVIVVGILTVRVAATFNVTEWLENRHKRRKEALRVLCPHATVVGMDEKGRVEIRCHIVSPAGTLQAQCQQCGMVFSGGLHVAEQVLEEWARNPAALLEREKLFVKRAKRLYRFREP